MQPKMQRDPAEVRPDQGKGSKNYDEVACTDEHSKQAAPHQGIQSWSDLDELATELEWMAAWKEVLQWKLATPFRYFEPAHLEAELNAFKRESIALAQSYRSVV
jgi:hypothetical protein